MSKTSLTAAVVAWALSAGCRSAPPPKNSATPVTVAPAVRQTVPFTVTANGVVEPMQTVAIQPQISGLITDVTFHEGDEVQAGQVLFRVDPRPFQAALHQAEASLARDRAQAENAVREAERYKALVGKGYVTASQSDQIQAAALSQQAAVAADDAVVEGARLNLNYATIKAPIGGRTGSLLVRAGNVVRVPSATPLVVINQIQPILVRFTVPQRVLPDLQRVAHGGQKPAVRVAPSAADSSHNTPIAEVGALDFVDNAVDTTTGAVTLKARFMNSSRALWPGQFLTVTIDLFNERDALTVPAIAVQTGQSGDYVYVVDAAGEARMTPVQVSRTAGETAIIASGLATGARVVTDGQSRLFPGAKVVVRSPNGSNGSRVVEVGGDAQ